MIETTEIMLAERLKEIEDQIKFLRDERVKTKQALDVFRGNQEAFPAMQRQTIGGEPIFKEKVKLALREKYPQGATALDILAYLNERWDRQIVRSSLSPQLSRLKKEGVITLDNDIWKLAEKNSAPKGDPEGADDRNLQ